MKIFQTLASVVLVGSALAACSGGDAGGGGDAAGGSYCKDIAAAKPVFENLASGDLAQLEKGFATFHQLAAEAPEDLKEEWKTLDDAATTVEGALKEAGLKMSDLAGIQQGTIPEGVDVTKLTSLAADLQKLNTPDFEAARAEIAKQAKDSCEVELGGL